MNNLDFMKKVASGDRSIQVLRNVLQMRKQAAPYDPDQFNLGAAELGNYLSGYEGLNEDQRVREAVQRAENGGRAGANTSGEIIGTGARLLGGYAGWRGGSRLGERLGNYLGAGARLNGSRLGNTIARGGAATGRGLEAAGRGIGRAAGGVKGYFRNFSNMNPELMSRVNPGRFFTENMQPSFTGGWEVPPAKAGGNGTPVANWGEAKAALKTKGRRSINASKLTPGKQMGAKGRAAGAKITNGTARAGRGVATGSARLGRGIGRVGKPLVGGVGALGGALLGGYVGDKIVGAMNPYANEGTAG